MKSIIISSSEPFDIWKEVRSKFPNSVRAVVCAFGIVCVWYEDDTMLNKVAQELYTNIPDSGSFVGVKTKFEWLV